MSETGPGPRVPETPRRRSRFVYALEIVSVRLRFIGLLVAVMLVAAFWDDVAARVERWLPHGGHEHAASDVEWFCPMHPQVIRGEPGTCPICGMPLSKRTRGAKVTLPEDVVARVQLSPYRVAQAGIRTTKVLWKPLVREVETVGFVEVDERRQARISARFPGRIESLAVDFTGTAVERGKPLATVYSPELLAAQESLLASLRSLRELETASGDPRSVERAKSLADAARTRLTLWGLWPEQVAAIERAGRASATVDVLAPLSGIVTRKAVVVGDYVAEGTPLFDLADLSSVWVKARVYEEDLGVVRAGQQVEATTTAFAGETFRGSVVFVEPFVDRASRTVGVRADLPNAEGRLRPGMYVVARVRVPMRHIEPFASMPRPEATGPRTVYWCPMHPEVVQDTPGECAKCGGMKLLPKELPGRGPDDLLAVPETAVVDTGRRRLVYVESSPGVFDAREVVLGPRAGTDYPVVRGVEAGMTVATAGSFLIDAETRLDPGAAGAYFGASSAPTGGDGGVK
jgi:membrane fusion protein, copper/silver efflux system